MCSRRVDQTVPVFRCGACDAYFSNGGATNYDDADLTEYYTRYAAAIRARYNRLMTEIERYCSVGSLIDIGSGMGFSLQVAKAREIGSASCRERVGQYGEISVV